MTDDLVGWLRAQLDEDERVARATMTLLPGTAEWHPADMQVRDAGDHLVVKHSWPAEIEHIARHDPARVLAEVAAKRRIIDRCAQNAAEIDDHDYGDAAPYLAVDVLRELASVYAGRPGWRSEWAPDEEASHG